MTEVHVSRVFRVDARSNPEVLEEIARLAKRGFTVLGPIQLEPVEALPESEKPAWEIVLELRKELKATAGLATEDIAALVGVKTSCVYQWSSRSAWPCPQARIGELRQLLERAKSLPEGSKALQDEARGARLATASLPKKRSPPLSDEQRLAIGILREQGLSIAKIASTVGRDPRSVKSALASLGA
jgi:hypothetical protein